MKKNIIIALILALFVIPCNYPSEASTTSSVDINVDVKEDFSLTISPTSFNFGEHNPGETSWTDGDTWTFDKEATVTAKCINNAGTNKWYLKVIATKLTNVDNSSLTIPYVETYDGKNYALFGWTATIPESAKGTVNEHEYSDTGFMKPYGDNIEDPENLVYTSAETEGGAEIYIWTGMKIPLSAVKGTYESTVTYTLAQ
jgi:hypothetical protein